MFAFPYLVEILTPRRSSPQPVEAEMGRFAEKYQRILDAGYGISIPDNPMGRPRFSALEAIESCRLPISSTRLMMNLNTFHSKSELDSILDKAAAVGIEFLLIVRGDGGPALSRLEPAEIGGKRSVPTSMDLLRYINTTRAGCFITGAAFNPYTPASFERDKLEEKIAAGARFAVTQPLIGRNPHVDRLADLNIPVVVEAWMSENVELLFKSVGKTREQVGAYDPVENLRALHKAYPASCVYLSMLSFTQEWSVILPRTR